MLAEQITATLEYFDVQEHALTLLEISKYLLAGGGQSADPYSLSEIAECISRDLAHQVGCASGFYVLRGREALAERRLHNNFYAGTRFKRARTFLPQLRHMPFVAGAAVTGSEALSNSKQGSDIDLLVLTQKNRLWLGRLSMALFFHVFGVRRYGDNIENRFCLNHYIERSKQLRSDQNIYTAIEYVSLVPYAGGDAVYEFQNANMQWIKKYLAQPMVAPYATPKPSSFKRAVEKLFNNRIGDAIERFAGNMQYRRIKVQEYITVEKDELSFHPGSKGQQVLKKFARKASDVRR